MPFLPRLIAPKLPRKLSLKWLLIGSVIGAMALFWAISITIILAVTWKESAKTYDHNLKESAHLLFHMAAQQQDLRSTGRMDGLEEYELETDRQYYQIIQNGQVIFHSRKGSSVPFVTQTHKKRGFYDVSRNGSRWRVFSMRSRELDLEVQVAQSVKQRQALLWDMVEHLGAQALLVLLVLSLIIAAIIYMVLKPLLTIAAQVTDRHPNHLDVLPNPYQTKELHAIVASINTLLDSLNHALQSERQFTANAAHELRTHLARLDMKVQLLQRKEPALAHYFHDIRAEIQSYTHMVSNLLLLARLDPINGHIEAHIHFEHLDLAALLHRTAMQLQAALAEKHMHLDLDLQPIQLWSSAELLHIMVHNIIDNAIKYCPAASRIHMVLRQDSEGICLSIADNGPGVDEAALAQLSQRFYRALGTQVSGSGLGLSIVNEICKALNIKVSIASGPEHAGMKFTFRFPPTPPRIATSSDSNSA